MKRTTTTLLWAIALFFGLGSIAQAKTVYLNGKKISDLTNQRFKKVDVYFDAKGDIYITNPNMDVKVVKSKKGKAGKQVHVPTTTPKLPKLTPKPSRKYVMIMQRDLPKASGYRFTVRVNGRLVIWKSKPKHIKRMAFDVTPFLRKGENQVTIFAIKTGQTPGEATIYLSEGTSIDGKLLVKKPLLLQYKRKGTDTKNYRHVFPVVIK